jgi:hypothetical protein
MTTFWFPVEDDGVLVQDDDAFWVSEEERQQGQSHSKGKRTRLRGGLIWMHFDT